MTVAPIMEALTIGILKDASGRPLTLDEVTAAFIEALGQQQERAAWAMSEAVYADLQRIREWYRTPKGRRAAHYANYMERLRPKHRRRNRR